MYYAIQDVLVAHKFLTLPEQDRARVDPLMNAFNLKDVRAGDYIKEMVHLYPGVWSGFGEIYFKKQSQGDTVRPTLDVLANFFVLRHRAKPPLLRQITFPQKANSTEISFSLVRPITPSQ